MVAKIGGKVPTIGSKSQYIKLTVKDGQVEIEVEGLNSFEIVSLATGLIQSEMKRLAEGLIKQPDNKEQVKH